MSILSGGTAAGLNAPWSNSGGQAGQPVDVPTPLGREDETGTRPVRSALLSLFLLAEDRHEKDQEDDAGGDQYADAEERGPRGLCLQLVGLGYQALDVEHVKHSFAAATVRWRLQRTREERF